MIDLKDQVIVVTGGETGIGVAAVAKLAGAGARVVIGGIQEEEGRAAEARLNREGGGAVEFRRTDVRDRASVDALIDGAVRDHGRIDALVNNAAVFDGFVDILGTSDGLWEQIINVNLRGTFFGCRAALRHMVEAGRGKIVNVSSIGGITGYADGPAYTASKHGVIGLTKQIGCEYARHGIAVNAVCPGSIETQIRGNSAKLLGADNPMKMGGVGADPDWLARVVPAQRKGQPDEIANVIVFLLSGMSTYLNGEYIVVDGGWTAK